MQVKTQLELEKQNLQMMITNMTNRINKSKQNNTLSDLSQSISVLSFYVDELVLKLKAYMLKGLDGKARVKTVPVKALTLISSELIAHYTLKTIINHMGSKNVTVNSLYTIIAKQLEVEFNLNEVKQKDKHSFKSLIKYLNESSHSGGRLTKMTFDLLQKYKKDLISHDINHVFLQVAQLAVNLLADCKPIIKNEVMPTLYHIGTINQKAKGCITAKSVIYPSVWFMDWINQQTLEGNFLSSYNTALIEEPKDWISLDKGGFHSERFQTKLIKTTIDSNQFDFDKMRNTVDAINHMQKTPWVINKDILDVMTYVFTNRLNWGGFPSPQEVQLSTYPFPNMQREDMTPDQLQVSKAWSTHHARLYNEYHAESSKYLAVNRAINEAKRFKDYDKLFFVYQTDFRGRIYPTASNLHPQGSEYIKSLLHFHEGKPLRDIESVMYLCAHGANTYGKDKINFKDKYNWVLENEKQIISVGNDPYSNEFWLDASEPWLFLAFCFEWSKYKKDPKNFLSRLPIALDGSCNGLQHLSAMLLDEVGGKSVNLIANIDKADIYEDVKNVTLDILKELNTTISNKIISFGITRNTTKRSVMIVPYAGTLTACRKYINDDLLERGGREFFGDDYNEALQLLTVSVWSAIGRVVIKGREVMEWFKHTTREVLKQTKSDVIKWHTPNGFQVIQKRMKTRGIIIQTAMGENILSRVSMTLQRETKNVDVSGHATSISPNFIHSLDACCLQETVLRCKASGITSLAMIHDSYGTHASDSSTMAKHIREVFFDIYSNIPVLENWLSEQSKTELLNINPLPNKGNLELSQVLQSEHFFS